jgi:hypothetical protein
MEDPPEEGRQGMLSRVKLHLAGKEYARAGERMDLPGGLTVRRVMAEYLGEMGKMAVREIKSKLGAHIKKVSGTAFVVFKSCQRRRETGLLAKRGARCGSQSRDSQPQQSCRKHAFKSLSDLAVITR